MKINTRHLINTYANLQPDGHFFSPGTMAFWSSRLTSSGIETAAYYLFVTSEKVAGGERKYTARRMSKLDGTIDTISQLGQFGGIAEARQALANDLIKWGV